MTALGELLAGLGTDVQAVVAFTREQPVIDRLEEDDRPVIVVAAEDGAGDHFVELPLEFASLRDRIRFGLEGALQQGILREGDEVVCLTGLFDGGVDTALRVAADEFSPAGAYDLFVNSRPDADVVRDVLDVVIELGKKGQKGKPVGALFVVGDAGKVMNKSRPLSYNPFEKSHVNVGDPIVTVMLKEFSRLDGAFIVSDSGKIVSAYRYLEPGAEGVDIPKGLGTRHMAAAAITRDTNAVAIVLSESDGLVRAFKAGDKILELDPEEY